MLSHNIVASKLGIAQHVNPNTALSKPQFLSWCNMKMYTLVIVYLIQRNSALFKKGIRFFFVFCLDLPLFGQKVCALSPDI